MFRRNLWKLTASAIIVVWALFTLMPLQDQPFRGYLQGAVTAKQADFTKLLVRVDERVAQSKTSGIELSDYSALKQIGRDEDLDLSQFFPNIRLEDSLKNIEKRNNILLDELLKRSKSRLQRGLDLKGGISFTLEANAAELAKQSPDARKSKLSKAIEIIGNRVNGLGVAEPIIRPIGDNRIEVQLPGVNTKNNPDVIKTLQKPAQLAFRLVYEGSGPMLERPTNLPPGYETLSIEEEDKHTGRTTTYYYIVKSLPEMSGEDIKEAIATTDQFGGFQVHLSFNTAGAKQFADVTTANRDRLLGVVLDGKLYSAPRINEPITGGSAQITGHFSAREADELANVLNNPLGIALEVKEMYEIGPSLAKDAIDSGVKASLIGAALVAAFMMIYYTVGGVLSVISLTLNLVVVLGVLASIGATLTMPGIAGIVLTVGMAVDANVLIYERMREEMSLGKNLKAAFHSGHDKVFSTIIDANLTTLITSVLMMVFGTGPVKGFGVTLTIGIFSTIFSALVANRMLLDMVIESDVIKKLNMLSFFKPPAIDFLKYGKKAFIASWVIIAVGIVAIAIKGKAIYGIDFVGGDDVTMTFAQKIETGKLRTTLTQAKIGEVNPLYQNDLGGGGSEVLKLQTETGKSAEAISVLTAAFPQAKFDVVGQTTIGPAVGKEIQWNAFMALGLSIVGILIYVAFRFEMGYGMGAVVSTIHDILMTISIFVLTDRQFTAPMVAAILLIAGYSINDTIVVFDRIREELKNNPTGTLRDVINFAINRVFSRSILTSFTTFLAAFALYLFGGGVINDLAFTFLVGIITGTFSSIFIASPIFFWWHKGDRKHVEAHHDIAPKYEWAGSSRASE